jgi:DNA-binding winged helix-turn-helix (wHTH) protein
LLALRRAGTLALVPAVAWVVVVGHGPELEREDGAAQILRGLGAAVRTLDLWDEPARALPHVERGESVRAIVVEAGERPDLAAVALRALRREPQLRGIGALVAVSAGQVGQLDPALGFDDFVLFPYVPAELYARLRAVEWRRSEFLNEERIKLGGVVVDRSAHEVTVDGRAIRLTQKELALLAYLCERRGKVVSRQDALARVWGPRYDGGPRTVDIHVRRLRSKLGDALALLTLRGAGYKIAVSDAAPAAAPRPVQEVRRGSERRAPRRSR